jgi:hypothetical protein
VFPRSTKDHPTQEPEAQVIAIRDITPDDEVGTRNSGVRLRGLLVDGERSSRLTLTQLCRGSRGRRRSPLHIASLVNALFARSHPNRTLEKPSCAPKTVVAPAHFRQKVLCSADEQAVI